MEPTILTRILVLSGYFAAVLIIGFIARSKIRETPESYFLANRGLGTFALVVTMAATNFSAFTIFGTSGAGYRDGFAFFPIMAFGTGFMAITFWLIGSRVWELGKQYGLISPVELIGKLYNDNKWLNFLFALVMIVFTVPYIAIQPMAGGEILRGLFGIPAYWGAIIVTLIILIYTLRGGMKAVAWTDVFQGFLMVGLMIIALGMVATHFGGLTKGLTDVRGVSPELFSRPGLDGRYIPAMWFSYMALWFFCDPMFPQLFQRFYTAKSRKSLEFTAFLYPAICTVVFFIPVTIGVLGHLSFPGLQGKAADNIMVELMTAIGGDMTGTLVLTAGLAALMSTMDSQLLTLSSIFTRDILPIFGKFKSGSESGTIPGSIMPRLFVVMLAMAGLVIALMPSGNIVDIAVKQAFTGLAVLFPTVFFGLYLEKPKPASALASIIAGELLVVLYSIPALKIPAWGFLPAVPVIAVAILAYLIVQLILQPDSLNIIKKISKRNLFFAVGFILIFMLAMDFWNWGKSNASIFSLPSWSLYFIGLSAVQMVLMWFWLRKKH